MHEKDSEGQTFLCCQSQKLQYELKNYSSHFVALFVDKVLQDRESPLEIASVESSDREGSEIYLIRRAFVILHGRTFFRLGAY